MIATHPLRNSLVDEPQVRSPRKTGRSCGQGPGLAVKTTMASTSSPATRGRRTQRRDLGQAPRHYRMCSIDLTPGLSGRSDCGSVGELWTPRAMLGPTAQSADRRSAPRSPRSYGLGVQTVHCHGDGVISGGGRPIAEPTRLSPQPAAPLAKFSLSDQSGGRDAGHGSRSPFHRFEGDGNRLGMAGTVLPDRTALSGRLRQHTPNRHVPCLLPTTFSLILLEARSSNLRLDDLPVPWRNLAD